MSTARVRAAWTKAFGMQFFGQAARPKFLGHAARPKNVHGERTRGMDRGFEIQRASRKAAIGPIVAPKQMR
jgi:hypothetical protein